eukprot:jgi/Psemu1/12937/gm1.12937_g
MVQQSCSPVQGTTLSHSPVQGTTVVTHTTNSRTSIVLGSEQTNTNDSQTETTPNSIKSDTLLTTKETHDYNMKQNITQYAKETLLRKMKFQPTKSNFVQSMIMRIVKLGNNNEIPNTINIKDQKWSGILCGAITACRHNAQTLAKKKNHKDNKRSNQILDSFPGTVLMMEKENTNSKNKKSFQTISNIFTPSNEALALLFVYNNYDLWLNTTEGTRKRKNFTDSKSGNEEVWSTQGYILYKYVLSKIEKRRKEQQSKDLEIELLKTYQQQNGKHTPPQDDEDEESKKKQRGKEQCDMIEY